MSPPQRRALWAGRAIDLANQALRLEPNSAEALNVRGQAQYVLLTTTRPANFDSLAQSAERDVRAALAERPDYASAWMTLAELTLRAGRYPEAALAAEEAHTADAFFQVSNVASTGFLATLRAERFDEAARWCQIGQSRYPGDPRFAECGLTLLGWTGRSARAADSAWRMIRGIEERDSHHMLDFTWRYRRLMVAAILARAGLRDSARQLLVLPLPPTGAGAHELSRVEEAYVRVLLGDRDGAIAALREQLQLAPQARVQIATSPLFKSLRADARFSSLVDLPK